MTPFLFAAVIALLLAIPLRMVAQRLGVLDRPGSHKSHAAPVPYLGGIAVMAACALAVVLFAPAASSRLLLLMLTAALGLFDDVLLASVLAKVVVQLSVAVAAVALGFGWHITDSHLLNGGLTVLWLVGITNAFNLLDNMDGLASTVAVTSLVGMAVVSPSAAVLALPLAGAALGFLVVNLSPWRMFLGDAGSLPLGLGVGLCTLALADTGRGLHSAVLLAFPVAVALFDTSLVIVSRLQRGRPIQLGGRDHFSHRLRLLGWSRWAILAAALVGTVMGVAIAGFAYTYPLPEAWIALPLLAIYAAAWLRLLGVDPYSAGVDARPEVLSA